MTDPKDDNPDDEELSPSDAWDEAFEDAFDDFLVTLKPIPDDLHSAYSNAPFENCIECEVPLGADVQYIIQKVFKGGESIFEFALCMGCTETTNSEMSEESRENIEAYMRDNAIELAGLEGCNLCGEVDRDEQDEYTLLAFCAGGHMFGRGMMVCDSCTRGLESLFSEATRRGMEDFTNRNFPGVPEALGLPVTAFPI